MAERAALSPRTLARRFHAATGYQQMENVHALRMEEAKQMPEMGTLAVDAIGLAVGYEDPASFRRLFKHLAGLTPGRYRRRFARVRAA